ncbi:MAG TPA: hypothetical protein VM222_03295 [Planctomycetota bacterium]|nr:hypothetical protein [Planctomycetota bacterium]
MRTLLAFLTCVLGTALAQESPPGGAPTFSVSLEQGWRISAESEVDFPNIQESDLTAGLNPKFTLKTSLNWPARDRDGRIMVKPKGSAAWKTNGDPIKLEATLVLLPQGACQLNLRKIEYSDRSQRYWIEFQAEKINAFDLGGSGKWSGTRQEWPAKRATVESAIREVYLKAVTPQGPPTGKEKIGLDIAGDSKAAWRLFATGSLEDQLAVLILTRLDGVPLERDKWPAELAEAPERPKQIARALIDRIQAQARGTFLPEQAKGGRVLKDQPWKGTEIAVPYPGWMDGREWVKERLQPVEEARERLRGMTEETNGKNSTTKRVRILDPGVWRSAVEEEAKGLRQSIPIPVPNRPGTFADALLPRTSASGTPTYDFKEKATVTDGQVQSSDADVYGSVTNFDVIFFCSGAGMNVWRDSVIRLETWYKSKIKRN